MYPHVNMDVKAYVGSKEASLNLNVGTGNFMQDHKLRMIHGRELTETELEKPIPVLIISEALFKKLYDTWENDLYIDIKGKPYNIVGVYKYDNIWQSNVYAGYTSVDNAPLISGVEEYNAVTIKLSSSSEREIVGKQAVSVLNGLKPPGI